MRALALILSIMFILSNSLLAQTSVTIPLNTLFGGAAYNQRLTITAVNSLISDGQNLWAGTYTVIPPSTTNPIVSLYPNTYLLTVAGVVSPVRFTVPASTNVLDITGLITSGPLFYFGTNGMANLIAGTNVVFVTNADGSITVSSSGGSGGITNAVATGGATASVSGSTLTLSADSAGAAAAAQTAAQAFAQTNPITQAQLPGAAVTNKQVSLNLGYPGSATGAYLYMTGSGGANDILTAGFGQFQFQSPVSAPSFIGPLNGTATNAANATNALYATTAGSASNLVGTLPASQLPAIVVTNGMLLDPLAYNFVKMSGGLSTEAQRDLNFCFTDLRNSGALTNFDDGVVFGNRFAPTNHLTLLGNTFTGTISNTPDGNADWVNLKTGGINFTLPTAATNITIAVCIDRMLGNWSVGAFNSNTLSAAWMDGGGALTWCWQRNGGLIPFNTNYNNYSNLQMPLWMNQYSYLIQSPAEWPVERHILILQRGVDSTVKLWTESIQSKIGLGSPAFTYTFTNTITDPLTTFSIAADPLGGAIVAGSVTNFQVMSAMVFNGTNASLIPAIYRAMTDLWPERRFDMFTGDSLIAYAGNSNDIPLFMENAIGNRSFKNYAQGGTKALDLQNTWNAGGGPSAITNLNREKFTTINAIFGHGINDIYANGATGSSLYTLVTNGIMASYQPWVNLSWLNIAQISTNGGNTYSYSLPYETNSWICNGMMYTNQSLISVIPRREYVSQFILNTNNGFSVDGLHENGTNSIVNQMLARLVLNPPPVDPFKIFNFLPDDGINSQYGSFYGTFTGNGAGLTNSTGGTLRSRAYITNSLANLANNGATNIFTIFPVASVSLAIVCTNYDAGSGYYPGAKIPAPQNFCPPFIQLAVGSTSPSIIPAAYVGSGGTNIIFTANFTGAISNKANWLFPNPNNSVSGVTPSSMTNWNAVIEVDGF